MANNTAVFGIYKQETQAAKAVDALREAGFRGTDISVLMPASPGTLLSVHCDDSEGRSAAREILERTGAEDIGASGDFASDHEADFRRNYATNHADLGTEYRDAAPLYEFGFRMARSERFAGKNFEDIEPELKVAYLLDFPEADWDRVSNLVLYGWEQAGGAIREGFALI
jgi:hypothetical protein